jgi:hypothetical protein
MDYLDPERGCEKPVVSQLGIAFSFNFIMAFLPFYILKVSDFSPQETMIWIGTEDGKNHGQEELLRSRYRYQG